MLQVILMLCADMLSSVVGIFWAVVSAVFYVMYVKWSDELNTRVCASSTVLNVSFPPGLLVVSVLELSLGRRGHG